jgi:hypothetical protein
MRIAHHPVKAALRLLAGLLAAAALLAPPAGMAQSGAASEEALKAAYLSKLRHYVEWPARAGQPVEARTVIAIVGADDVAEYLLDMPAARDAAKGFSVRRLRVGDSLDGVSLLFVGDAYFTRAAAMIEQANARSVLVVTESDNALSRGSVINFRLVDERIRFDISLESAEKSGLKLSSQLLALAVSVIREKRK